MTDYQNTSFQCVNGGVNLRNSPDRLADGKWVRLTNIRSFEETSITSRPGRKQIIPPLGTYETLGLNVHTLFKFDGVIVSGVGETLYRNGVAYPSTWASIPKNYVLSRGAIGETKLAYVTDYQNSRILLADGTELKWGILAPEVACSYAVTSETGPLNSTLGGSIYDWRQTFLNSTTGAESNPSPIAPGIPVVDKNVSINILGSLDPQVDRIRIYRRGGTISDAWRLVGTIVNPPAINGNAGGVVFIDNNSDSSIVLSKILDLDNDLPFTSVMSTGEILNGAPVPYIFGPFLGNIILAVGDPNRPGHVYWTNPGRPHSASVNNNIVVSSPDEPLLGGFIYNDLPYVFSRKNFYALDYGAGGVFTSRKLDIGRGCSAPHAVTVGDVVYFLSKDNVYMSDMQGSATPLTEEDLRPLFNPNIDGYDYTAPGAIAQIDWGEFDINSPSLIDPNDPLNYAFLAHGGQQLRVTYRGNNGSALPVYTHLVNDLLYNRWSNDEVGPLEETICFYDTEQSTTSWIIGVIDGRVALETGIYDYLAPETTPELGNFPQCRARTRYEDFSIPQTLKEFGNVIVDANVNSARIPLVYGGVGNGVVVTTYYDTGGSLGTPQVVNGVGRQNFPLALPDHFAYNIALDFEWNGSAIIYQYTLMWRPDEEWITHWEFPPTTFGSRGWGHIRDLYLTLRANAPGTISVEVDGVVYLPRVSPTENSGVIPSTNGQKQKLHFWCPPVKGKLYRFILNGGPFRLYGNECEVRVKEFNNSLTYQLVSPFGSQ